MNIAVCDDNKETLIQESSLIDSVLSEQDIEHSMDKFINPESLLKSEKLYDIVFLDIEMNDFNGIEVAKKLRNENKECLIFFITNYETYLDDAFNQRAFRFWTKPLDTRKLTYGLKSAVAEIESFKHHINIKIKGETQKIFLQNIIYIYMENKRLHVVTTKSEIIADNTLTNIHSQIKGINYFCECCRGYYVNFNFIKNYTRNTIICTYKQLNYTLDISRRKYNSFHKAFISWIGER